ncbi:MAG: ATPase, T2SS/T4P/T4SS family [Gemmatimonadales bacterium]
MSLETQSVKTLAQASDLEQLLLREGAVDEAQLERARRIRERLQQPKRLAEILVDLGQLPRAEYDRIVRRYRSSLSLSAILHDMGVLDAAGLARFEAARLATPGARDQDLLVGNGLVTEEQYLRALALRHDLPYLEPEVGLVDPAVMGKTSLAYLLRNKVLPLRIADGALTAILADPLNAQTLGDLERIYKVPVVACCAPAARIEEALHTLERLREGKSSNSGIDLHYRQFDELVPGENTAEGAVAVLDYLLLRSIQLGASDLHIEPLQHKVRVRIRVDGVLQPLTDLPGAFAAQAISRVKVLAGTDIAERRLHQDGRISVRVEGREVDFRVSTYAGMFGETLVLRLLDRRRALLSLDDLGFHPKILSSLREVVLRSASGMVLVTGPTGSGKTTTLYSFVDYVNDPTVKVISCEDPVEYVLEGVSQCSVNNKTGPTFADSLRAIVRQDPDIIIVGEIRDPATAALAVEAALTGHQVFSTLHTEDAVGAMVRLADMGVEPFLVSSTVSCVVAQRLVRKLCAHCRRPAEIRREDLRFLGLDRTDLIGLPLMEGAGCKECGGTGYRGRIGIHEVLVPDDDFKDAVLRRAPSKELRALARRLPGFLTLQESGLLTAIAGRTTLAAVVADAPRDAKARKPDELREVAGMRRFV